MLLPAADMVLKLAYALFIMEFTTVSGLKITLLQQPLVWMDGPANLRHFDRQLEEVSGRDIIVLPEMFTTGFAMEAAKQSMPQGDSPLL